MDLDAQKRRCIERIVGKLDIYFLHDTRKAANELYALQSSIDERDVAVLQDKKAPLFEKAAARKRLAAKEILWDEKASPQSKKIAQETLGEYQPKLAYALEVFEHLQAALSHRSNPLADGQKTLLLSQKRETAEGAKKSRRGALIKPTTALIKPTTESPAIEHHAFRHVKLIWLRETVDWLDWQRRREIELFKEELATLDEAIKVAKLRYSKIMSVTYELMNVANDNAPLAIAKAAQEKLARWERKDDEMNHLRRVYVELLQFKWCGKHVCKRA